MDAIARSAGGSGADAHLGERQAVLVRLLVLQFEVVQGLALWRWLRQLFHYLHEVGGEEAVHAAHLTVVPVLVHLPPQDDDVALAELQVAGLLAVVVVKRLGTGELRHALRVPERSRVNSHMNSNTKSPQNK